MNPLWLLCVLPFACYVAVLVRLGYKQAMRERAEEKALADELLPEPEYVEMAILTVDDAEVTGGHNGHGAVVARKE